jgi:NAD-binding of NADP-dependent 3-hydroxyisobutyrate dehydrogenase
MTLGSRWQQCLLESISAAEECDQLAALAFRQAPDLGENGQGLVLKLAINISLAAQVLAFAEGLLLAERGGIDPSAGADVMAASPIGSPMLKARPPLILDLPDEAWFDIGLTQKDIVLALQAARELRVPLPSAAVADEMLTLARAPQTRTPRSRSALPDATATGRRTTPSGHVTDRSSGAVPRDSGGTARGWRPYGNERLTRRGAPEGWSGTDTE